MAVTVKTEHGFEVTGTQTVPFRRSYVPSNPSDGTPWIDELWIMETRFYFASFVSISLDSFHPWLDKIYKYLYIELWPKGSCSGSDHLFMT